MDKTIDITLADSIFLLSCRIDCQSFVELIVSEKRTLLKPSLTAAYAEMSGLYEAQSDGNKHGDTWCNG